MIKFRRWLARIICSISRWIDYKEIMPDSLEHFVAIEVENTDKIDAGGEFKRHLVYAATIKEFPQVKKNDIGIAIEATIKRLRRNT